jgi:hypothetical protein
MRIHKRVALAISGAAFAGTTVLALGVAGPAGAQAITTAPHHAVASAPHQANAGHVVGAIRTDGWGWDDDDWGWDGGWDGDWDDCC